MKPFFLTVLAGLVFVLSVVYVVDPGHLLHPDALTGRIPLQGEAAPLSIWHYGPRALKLAHLTQIVQPDLVLMGSSRVMLVNFHLFSPATHFFNLAVERPNYKDYIGFWEALLEAGKRPRYVIIIPDGFAINRKVEIGPWLSTLKYFNRFVENHIPAPKTKSAAVVHSAMAAAQVAFAYVMAAKEFMTWEMFRDSLKSLVSPHPERRWRIDQVFPETKAPQGSLYYGDGAVESLPSPAEGALANALIYGKRDQGLQRTLMDPWGLDPKAIHWLNVFLQDAHEKGTHVMFIIPPYHPETYKNLTGNEPLAAPYRQYIKAFQELTQVNSGADFCNAFDPQTTGCTADDFIDALHLHPSGGEKMLRYCLRGRKGWDKI